MLLIACHQCGRQFDVTRLSTGTTVHCSCGAVLTAEHREGHEPRALRCTGCGGPLEDGARRCGFCACEVTLEERRLSGICPVCFARMATGARYCMECGVGIQPQVITSVPHDAACPRCQAELQARVVSSTSVVECSHCAGLWLSPECFERITQEAERQDTGAILAALPTAPAGTHAGAVDVRGVQYLPCPVCKDLMLRRNFAIRSGVIIDLCRDHGVWLDHSELQQIVEFIRSGGMLEARKAEMRQLRDQANHVRNMPAYTPEVILRERRLPELELVELMRWLGAGIRRLFR